MTTLNERARISVTLPITDEIKQIADTLAAQQPNLDKARQVWLNALAVGVMKNYFEMMNVPTDLRTSDSQNAWLCMAADIADLVLPGLGKIECRPVKAGQDSCYVPIESWVDRIGYVAVILDEAASRATIDGFLPNVGVENVPLKSFQPTEMLLKHIEYLSQPSVVVQIGQWLDETVQVGWQAVETLLMPQQLAYQFNARSLPDDQNRRIRSPEQSTLPPSDDLDAIKQAKVIHFNDADETSLMMKLALFPKTENDSSASQRVIISINPFIDEMPLPEGVHLELLSSDGTVVEEKTAQSSDWSIGFDINVDPGDRFDIRVSLDGAVVQEQFVL
jgi:hypothetical protein